MPTPLPEAMYYVVVAARNAAALPHAVPVLSLFSDRADSELARAEANAREVLRLDALLRESNAARDRQTDHIRHLEDIVHFRDRIIEERGAQLAALNQSNSAMQETLREEEASHRAQDVALAAQDAALAAQERVIEYRGSLRWWLRLPWLRLRRLWSRWTGG
jgi:septal ring factor EnvC (AmiA/AmiB activator)